MTERKKGHSVNERFRESPHYKEIEGKPGMFAYKAPLGEPNRKAVIEARGALIIKKAREKRKNEGK